MSNQRSQELALMLSSMDRTMSAIYQRPNQKTELVSVPSNEHVAQIVGKNGYKIKNLRAATKTVIKTPLFFEPSVFSITGTEEDVRTAADAIRMASKHFDNVIKNKSVFCAIGEVKVLVPVPAYCVGAVVGRNGHVIVSIKEQTNTRINSPKGGAANPMFEVMGSRANVKAAKLAIENRIKTVLLNKSFNANHYNSLLEQSVRIICEQNYSVQ